MIPMNVKTFRLYDENGVYVAEGILTAWQITQSGNTLSSEIEFSGELMDPGVYAQNPLTTAKPAPADICECGAAKTGAARGAPGHSSWCPWSKA